MNAPIPDNDEARLEVLKQYRILDTAAEKVFDDITTLAAEVCETPISVLSFIDRDRRWAKSNVGLSQQEAGRDISLCSYAILQNDLLVVPDARADERFAHNPGVTAEPGVRFYAGMPLVTPEGLAIGTLCVVDHVPRQLTEEQANKLRALAGSAMILLEVRRRRS